MRSQSTLPATTTSASHACVLLTLMLGLSAIIIAVLAFGSSTTSSPSTVAQLQALTTTTSSVVPQMYAQVWAARGCPAVTRDDAVSSLAFNGAVATDTWTAVSTNGRVRARLVCEQPAVCTLTFSSEVGQSYVLWADGRCHTLALSFVTFSYRLQSAPLTSPFAAASSSVAAASARAAVRLSSAAIVRGESVPMTLQLWMATDCTPSAQPIFALPLVGSANPTWQPLTPAGGASMTLVQLVNTALTAIGLEPMDATPALFEMLGDSAQLSYKFSCESLGDAAADVCTMAFAIDGVRLDFLDTLLNPSYLANGECNPFAVMGLPVLSYKLTITPPVSSTAPAPVCARTLGFVVDTSDIRHNLLTSLAHVLSAAAPSVARAPLQTFLLSTWADTVETGGLVRTFSSFAALQRNVSALIGTANLRLATGGDHNDWMYMLDSVEAALQAVGADGGSIYVLADLEQVCDANPAARTISDVSSVLRYPTNPSLARVAELNAKAAAKHVVLHYLIYASVNNGECHAVEKSVGVSAARALVHGDSAAEPTVQGAFVTPLPPAPLTPEALESTSAFLFAALEAEALVQPSACK